jgi:hypothetical protein
MFARLETWFNAFFLGYAARVSGDLAVGLVPIALLLVTVYVAVYGLAVMRGEATEPVGTFAWKMVKVGAILSFALPGLYYSGNVVAWATGLQDGLAVLFVAPRAVAAATAFGALDLANTAACFGSTWCCRACCSLWEQRFSLSWAPLSLCSESSS